MESDKGWKIQNKGDFDSILKRAYDTFGSRPFIHEKKNTHYESISYGEFIEDAVFFAHYLLDLGLKGDRIILWGENSTNYMIADVAIMAFVGVSVTVSRLHTGEDIGHIVEFLDVKAILYSEKQEGVEAMKKAYPNLHYLCILKEFPSAIEQGKTMASGLFEFEKKDPKICSKIVFSSGTTASPKAVQLSLQNIFAGWESLCRRVSFTEEDICYLYLPLHHTYGNIYNFLYAFLWGMQIYLCSGIHRLFAELREVRPTLFCSVPKIYEDLVKGKKDLKQVFGGRILYLFSGGAKTETYIKQEFDRQGLFLYDAYALSETAYPWQFPIQMEFLMRVWAQFLRI